MATRKAAVVSAKNLSKTIDRAVALASKRHDLRTEPGNLILNWEIVGRRVRASTQIDIASGFAQTVAQSLSGRAAIPAVSPIVIGPSRSIGKWILVGFWDPDLRDRLGTLIDLRG